MQGIRAVARIPIAEPVALVAVGSAILAPLALLVDTSPKGDATIALSSRAIPLCMFTDNSPIEWGRFVSHVEGPFPFMKKLITSIILSSISVGFAFAQKIDFQTSFDDSESLDAWFPTQPDKWKLTDGSLHLLGASKKYNPPFRSPHSITLLKDKIFGDFVLTAKVKTLQDSRGHRDMCIFWGWQNPSNFYYVHLGEKPDPNSSQIFIVKDAPRSPITKTNQGGIPWKEQWHDVKLVRKVESGTIDVYFDDMETPVKTAVDTTYQWGMIGLGSFDDLGMWDDVRINGELVEGKAAVLPTPNRSGPTDNGKKKKPKK